MVSVKVSFIGTPAVGKSTLMKLLTSGTPNLDYIPTMGLDFGSVKLGEHEIKLWDIGGQKQFESLWNSFLQGTLLTVVVTDSSPQNVLQTKRIVDMLARKSNSRVIAVATHQDCEGNMNSKRVEDVLHVPTYPIVAIEEKNQEKIKYILIKELLEATGNGEKDE